MKFNQLNASEQDRVTQVFKEGLWSEIVDYLSLCNVKVEREFIAEEVELVCMLSLENDLYDDWEQIDIWPSDGFREPIAKHGTIYTLYNFDY